MSKLTKTQIKQMKKVQSKGVRLSFLAKVMKYGENIHRTTVYYHLSPNRNAYEYSARKARDRQKEAIREKLQDLVKDGKSTGDIARDWGVPLKTINNIYTS